MNITTTGKESEREINKAFVKPTYEFTEQDTEEKLVETPMKSPEVIQSPFGNNRLQIRIICKSWRPTMDKEIGHEIPKQCGACFYVGFIDARIFEQHNFIANCRVCQAAYNVFYQYNPLDKQTKVETSYREVSIKSLEIYNKYLRPYADANNNYNY